MTDNLVFPDSFIIGIVLVVIAALILAVVFIGLVLAMVLWRRSAAAPKPESQPVNFATKSLDNSMPPQSMQKPVDSTVDFKGEAAPPPPIPTEVQHDETRPVPVPPSVPPPVPDHLSSGAPLLGFFDDELSTRDTGRDAATELFQRGAHSFNWDDDDEEDGATEVFSPHHVEELGEFTIEEDDSI